MSPEEALWFHRASAAESVADLSPLLNIGSSTLHYRTVVCPFIEDSLFAPLEKRGVRVIHLDHKEGTGVDITGDILDPVTQGAVRQLGIRSVVCNNLLEHVADIGATCTALREIVPADGLLLLSVPSAYPYHPDPIDNGFRPSLEALEALLGSYGFRMGAAEVLSFGRYIDSLKRRPRLLARDAYMVLAGLANREKRRVVRENYRFLLRPFKVACAVFRKRG